MSETSEQILNRLRSAMLKPEAQKNIARQNAHFDKYGDDPITEETYDALPDFMKILYETPE